MYPQHPGLRTVNFSWPQEIDPPVGQSIVTLMRATTATDPIIGFGTSITDIEAAGYVAELREQVRAGKWRFLRVRNGTELIGMCTLRRNLNPNNRHIADLAKGMIAHQHRGGPVLAGAFCEIAEQCQRDGVEVLTLDVRSGTAAHKVWRRFGFREYGILEDYARVDGRSVAGHFMMQKVSELRARARASLQVRVDALAQIA